MLHSTKPFPTTALRQPAPWHIGGAGFFPAVWAASGLRVKAPPEASARLPGTGPLIAALFRQHHQGPPPGRPEMPANHPGALPQ